MRSAGSASAVAGASSEGVTVITADAGAEQQITIINSKEKTIRVYHVDRMSGRISLKSVRNIHWDGQMEEFNVSSPSPREIRSLVTQR